MATNAVKKILEAGGISGNTTDEVLKNFEVKCPVYKLNLKPEHPNFIAGMYALTNDDGYEFIKSKVDDSDLSDSTILMFTPRHIIDLAHFINGLWYLITKREYLSEQARISGIMKMMNIYSGPMTYFEYKKVCHMIASHFGAKLDFSDDYDKRLAMEKVYERIGDIMRMVIFIPYGAIDTLAEMAIDFYKKEGDNNEGGTPESPGETPE